MRSSSKARAVTGKIVTVFVCAAQKTQRQRVMVRAGEMTKHGCLTYKRLNNKVIRIEDNVELRLMVINSEVARVRFTNSENERIDFPQNIEIRKLHHGQQDAQSEAVVDNEIFLTRYNSYIVLRAGQTLFRLENQTQQAIEGGADLVVMVP